MVGGGSCADRKSEADSENKVNWMKEKFDFYEASDVKFKTKIPKRIMRVFLKFHFQP